MRSISHKFICKLFETFETENSLYLILELVDGGDLFSRLAQRSSLTEDIISTVLRNILSALEYLHLHGIVHRDLKPQNILVKSPNSNDLEIRIVDFGLSSGNADERKRKTEEFCVCGTPGFIAPEVLAGKYEGDGKCDVFSLGIMFYIMLTGKSPFEGRTRLERLEQNQRCEIDFTKIQSCSPSARFLLSRMLCPDPLKRFSASECLASEFLKPKSHENFEELSLDEGISRSMRKFIEFSL